MINSSFLTESIIITNSSNSTEFSSDLTGQAITWINAFLMLLDGLAVMFLMNGILEFVCAQSPYSMRGLLSGCSVFLIVCSVVVCVEVPFITSNVMPNNTNMLCIIKSTVLSLVGFILHCVLAHWYKRRVRDEDYPVHRVVEEVYDRYLSQAAVYTH